MTTCRSNREIGNGLLPKLSLLGLSGGASFSHRLELQAVTSIARGRVTALALREAWSARRGQAPRRFVSFLAHAADSARPDRSIRHHPCVASRLRTLSQKLGRFPAGLGVEPKQASSRNIDAQRFHDAQRFRFARSPTTFPSYLPTEGWRNQGPHKRHNRLADAPNLEMATRVSAGTNALILYTKQA